MEDVRLFYQAKLLSFLLANQKAIDDCSGIIPEYFSDEAYGEIFSFFKECREKGLEISPIKVVERFGNGCVEFLKSIVSMNTSELEVNGIIKCLKQEGQRKFAIDKLKDIVEKSKDPLFDVFKAISEIEPYEKEETKDFKSLTLSLLEYRMNNKGKLGGISSGIDDFDETINGFNKGLLYVCAGRSSMGKSAFMTSAVANIEKFCGVGIISLEMTGEELYNRVCAVRTSIPYWVIDRGKATDEQFDRVASTISKINKLNIYDKGGLNTYQVCSKIRQMAKEGCKIVFVDHLGLIHIDDKGNLAHNIGKITSALKSLAKELQIPIVVLSQVNRVTESQEDKRPTLKDLRDSGRIEEDADCVFFLYRDEYYNPITTPDGKQNRIEQAEILVEKNRNGACKNIRCQFDNQLMKFY